MAPGNSSSAGDKKKGKDKAPAEPKKSTRLTRQTSAVLELDTALGDSAGDDDVEAIAANALADGDTEGEDELLQPENALAHEQSAYVTEYAGYSHGGAEPSTPAANTGRRADRTPATAERPAKRTRERTQQSPWHPAQPTSIFPLDRAQVVAERTANAINATPALAAAHTRTADTHIHGGSALNESSHMPTGAAATSSTSAASFTLSQEQLLAIIAAAQAGTLSNLAHAPLNAITAALGVPAHSRAVDPRMRHEIMKPQSSCQWWENNYIGAT
ncbi:hypothetical protein H0H92_004049 [Tricholoma furcatifolium]|nr:hypothetical protein H0H92_004049 [Tricholoma furcatifolium]